MGRREIAIKILHIRSQSCARIVPISSTVVPFVHRYILNKNLYIGPNQRSSCPEDETIGAELDWSHVSICKGKDRCWSIIVMISLDSTINQCNFDQC